MTYRMCIVGGGGYLGQHIARELQDHGHYTVLLDVTFIDISSILQLNEEFTKRVKGSLLDQDLLDEALQGCYGCFHIAAYGMNGLASKQKDKIYQINVDGTNCVINRCLANNVKHLVYASSVSVIFNSEELYFADESLPYATKTKFISHYRDTKITAEKIVLESDSENLKTCALRLRGLYGPAEPRSVEKMVVHCLRGLTKTITEKTGGGCMTQYTSVRNCATAMRLAEEGLRSGVACGNVYNIMDGGPPVRSIHFWFPLIEALGMPVPKIYLPYSIAVFITCIYDQLYNWLGMEPLFTRLEIDFLAITNTFSIERAKRDLGYNPVNNHDLTPVVEYYRKKLDSRLETHSSIFDSKIFVIILLILFIYFLLNTRLMI